MKRAVGHTCVSVSSSGSACAERAHRGRARARARVAAPACAARVWDSRAAMPAPRLGCPVRWSARTIASRKSGPQRSAGTSCNACASLGAHSASRPDACTATQARRAAATRSSARRVASAARSVEHGQCGSRIGRRAGAQRFVGEHHAQTRPAGALLGIGQHAHDVRRASAQGVEPRQPDREVGAPRARRGDRFECCGRAARVERRPA